jgi:hypothetical protein
MNNGAKKSADCTRVKVSNHLRMLCVPFHDAPLEISGAFCCRDKFQRELKTSAIQISPKFISARELLVKTIYLMRLHIMQIQKHE